MLSIEEMHRGDDLSLLSLRLMAQVVFPIGSRYRHALGTVCVALLGHGGHRPPWVDGPALAPLHWAVLCLAPVFWSQMVLQLVASCSWALPA